MVVRSFLHVEGSSSPHPRCIGLAPPRHRKTDSTCRASHWPWTTRHNPASDLIGQCTAPKTGNDNIIAGRCPLIPIKDVAGSAGRATKNSYEGRQGHWRKASASLHPDLRLGSCITRGELTSTSSLPYILLRNLELSSSIASVVAPLN